MLELVPYFDAVVAGLVISVGGLSEAVVKESSAALLKWCRAKKAAKSWGSLERLACSVISLFEAHSLDDRVIVPLLKTIDLLLKNDNFYFLEVRKHTFAARLLQVVKKEINRTNDVGKLRLGIELLILLLGFDDPVRPAALRSLVMLVGHKYPKVRKHASELLYLQLLSDNNVIGPTPSEVEVNALSGADDVNYKCGLCSSAESLERANEILLTTEWDGTDLAVLRRAREELGTCLGFSIVATTTAPMTGKALPADELTSYSSLVRDAGY